MPDVPIPSNSSSESSGMELIIHPTFSQQSAQFTQVVKYVEALKAGKKPTQAARDAGTTIGVLRLQGKAIGKYLAKARQEYAATAEEIREITVLKWMERAMMDRTDANYDGRETMMALHELSAIPEVGLKGKALPAANGTIQFSEETQQVLDSIDIEDGD